MPDNCPRLIAEYDAILFVSFGGPEGPDDVLPFLENVLRGKPVPRERMLEVAEHYNHFGGVSPINEQTRQLIDAVKPELAAHGIDLPVYWGNRNWHPMLADTLRQMKADGVRRAVAFVVSGYSSYSGCRQYREDIYRALTEIGAADLWVDKIRVFYNHPDFVAANADRVSAAMARIPADRHATTRLVYTAHSIPTPMAERSAYSQQLEEACRLTSEAVGVPEGRWALVYQSRSGRPTDPWLEPDVCDHIASLKDSGATDVVVHPIGFLSDHMEVMFDLDTEAQDAAKEAGLSMQRAETVGVHPRFVTMVRKLIEERMGRAEPEAVGRWGANHDVCPVNCCGPGPAPARRPAVAGRGGRPATAGRPVAG